MKTSLTAFEVMIIVSMILLWSSGYTITIIPFIIGLGLNPFLVLSLFCLVLFGIIMVVAMPKYKI